MTASLAVALVSGIAVGLLVGIGVAWLAPRLRRAHKTSADAAGSSEARLARDFTVLAELLAERLAKIWLADTPGAPAADGDALYHHVLESTTTIVRQAGASPKGGSRRGRAHRQAGAAGPDSRPARRRVPGGTPQLGAPPKPEQPSERTPADRT